MADLALAACKYCSRCRETKDAIQFSKDRSQSDGLSRNCRPCRNSLNKRWYSGLGKDGQIARRERIADQKREYQAQYYRANKDQLNEYSRKWVQENRQKHRDSVREAMRRKRSTAKGRLESNVGRAVNRALMKAKSGEPSFKLLGFAVEELMRHLQRQFLPGMTWENYGKWHVDHILPLASFEYQSADDADFKVAWALTNLRPMWARDNISKGAKRLHLV